jgi:hypothetical protein
MQCARNAGKKDTVSDPKNVTYVLILTDNTLTNNQVDHIIKDVSNSHTGKDLLHLKSVKTTLRPTLQPRACNTAKLVTSLLYPSTQVNV